MTAPLSPAAEPLRGRVLCARLDSAGDVLLAGPAVRAVAAQATSVTMLVGPDGAQAAELLPGVDDVLVFDAPWSGVEPSPVCPESIDTLITTVRSMNVDAALIFTSFHQSSLPLALVLRQAGVGWIGAVSEDYPGSLLDLRAPDVGDLPESARMLALATAAGAAADSAGSRLAVRMSVRAEPDDDPYVVVHPGAAVSARMPSPDRSAAIVRGLRQVGYRVIVTHGPDEAELGAYVARSGGADLVETPTFADLAEVLAAARVVVAPNTGPAHLAAAVGTPVVSLFAPVVSATRWAPHGVPTVILGDQSAPCHGSRARHCPVDGHPCLDSISPLEVTRAVGHLWCSCAPPAHSRQFQTTVGSPS